MTSWIYFGQEKTETLVSECFFSLNEFINEQQSPKLKLKFHFIQDFDVSIKVKSKLKWSQSKCSGLGL